MRKCDTTNNTAPIKNRYWMWNIAVIQEYRDKSEIQTDYIPRHKII